MPIERQSEQWPHRREAMLRAAAYYTEEEQWDREPGPHGERMIGDQFDRDYFRSLRPRGRQMIDFPPDRINPPSSTFARPKTQFIGTDAPQPTLDLDLPSGIRFHDRDYPKQDYVVPTDRKPIKLYRGVSMRLNRLHPDLTQIRRHFFGDELEAGLNEDSVDINDWERGQHFNFLPGMPPTSDLARSGKDPWGVNPEMAHRILDWIGPSLMDQRHSGLGAHWTTDSRTAQGFAIENWGVDDTALPVVVSADWHGHGEDPYRTDTGGDYDDEKEITLLPGAPLHVTNVHVQHPETGNWHAMMPEPQHRLAADHSDRINMPTKPYSTARPKTYWEGMDAEQDVLPLNYPNRVLPVDGQPGMERTIPGDKDVRPQVLYRGLSIPLTHPDLGAVRAAFMPNLGPSMANGETLPLPGMGKELEWRDGWPRSRDLPEGFDPTNLGHHILNWAQDNREETGLGRHWSTEQHIADTFAHRSVYNSVHGVHHVPVRLTAEWTGLGEDTKRSHTGGEFHGESEITMVPGTNLRVTGVHVWHPRAEKWYSVLDQPQHRTAAGPFNLHDTDYYKGRSMVPVHAWDYDSNPLGPVAGNKAYNFPATGFNPPSSSRGRPRLTWQSTGPEQDMLPMDFPTETTIGSGVGPDHPSYKEPHSLPYDRRPQTLYRGVTVDLAHPDAAHIRRTLYGPGHEETFGHHGHPPLPGMPTTEDLADHWNAYDYENQGLGPMLLDHLSDHYDHHSLGQHWSIYPNVGMEFGEDGDSRAALPLNVVLSAEWRGAGEDPYRRATMGNWPHEGEITLLPDAPLHVTNVHVQHPHTKKWHNVLDTPQHRQAALFYDRGDYDPGDFFSSRGGTCTMCKRPRRLPPGPFCSHGEGDEEFRRRLELDPNTPFRTAGYYDEDWDEDDDYHEGTPQEVHPIDTYTPMFPGSGRRPVFHDRDLGRDVYHFSPHERNPQSDGYTRPELNWRAQTEDPDQPGLPGIPADRQPVRLYRGVSVDLDRPEAHRLRRLVHPQRFDNREDAAGFQRRPIGWGQIQEEPYLGVDMSNKELRSKAPAGGDYDPDEVRQLVLDHLLHYGDGGLGTHWSTDKGQAQMFARHNSNAMGTNILPVVLHHDWYGHGEDPYRRGTEGEWSDEQEITKLPHAAVNLVGMDIWHDDANGLSKWRNIYSGDPLRHEAGVR